MVLRETRPAPQLHVRQLVYIDSLRDLLMEVEKSNGTKVGINYE